MAVERGNLRSLGRVTGMGTSDAIFRKESPPDDDVCPVCFGNFDLPCQADCGHWFCGSCILQVWSFSSALRACKCPMCCRLIQSLKPYFNPDEEEARKVLKSIERYNRIFVGGPRGFVLALILIHSVKKINQTCSNYAQFLLKQKLYDAPLLLRRLFREMTDPNQVHRHVHSWRLLALMLGNLYLISPFKFIPEGVDLVTLCNISAILVVLFIMVLGVFKRRRAADRVRRLAAIEIQEDV